MATVPDEKGCGRGHSTAINGINHESTLNDGNDQAREGHKVELAGTWDTVSAGTKAYHETTKVKAVVFTSDAHLQQSYPEGADSDKQLPRRPSKILSAGQMRLSGSLSEIISDLEHLGRERQVKLTLFLSDVHSTSNKRRRMDDEVYSGRSSDQHLHKNKDAKEILENDPKLCGNCGANGHKAAVCDRVGESGWMEACCKCDSIQHTYEFCPRRRQEEDFTYLILNRGNKGPVKCSLHLGRVVLLELSRRDSPYKDDHVIDLPFSSSFSRQEANTFPYSRYDDGDPVEPARRNQSLGRAVSILRDQRWTIEDHEIDHNGYPCENCCADDHSVYQCAGSCGFCGSNNHHTLFCKDKDKACLCDKYPSHVRWDCNEKCWYCNYVLKDRDFHDIKQCSQICHYCLNSDHTMEECKAFMGSTDRACPRCPEETYHFPSFHVLCPGDKCKRLISKSPCEEHCLDCG